MKQTLLKVLKKKNLHLRLLMISSLLAILPVILLGISSNIIFDYSLRQEIGKATKETMQQIQQRVDEKLRILDRTILNHAIHIKTKEYIYKEDSYDYVQKNQEIVSVLKSILLLTEDVHSIFFYLEDERPLLYSNMGLVDLNEMNPQIITAIKNHGEKSLQWLDIRLEKSINRNSSHVVTLIRKIPNQSSEPNGYLIVNINDTAFFKIFDKVILGKNGELLILTPSGNIFSDWKKTLLKEDFDQYPFIKDASSKEIDVRLLVKTIEGRRMLINHIESSYNGWKYVTVIPMQDLLGQSKWIKNITILMCLMIVGSSLLTAFILSNKAYKIIRNTASLVEIKRTETKGRESMNELELISYYLETLNSVNDSLMGQVTQTKMLLFDDFIKKLILGNVEGNKEDKFRFFGITPNSLYFSVIYIEFMDEGKAEKDNILLDAAMNISKEVITYYADSFTIKMNNGQMLILVNHRSEGKDFNQEILGISFAIYDAILHFVKTNIRIGVGKCYEGYDQIHKSYNDSINALKYASTTGNRDVFYAGNISLQNTKNIYPIKIEHRILICIKIGNIEQIYTLLDEFASALTYGKLLNNEYNVQSFYQLVTSSIRELQEIDKEGGVLFEYNLYNKIEYLKNTEDIILWMKDEFCPVVLKRISDVKGRQSEKSIEIALQYIHSNFDKEISLTLISQLVSVPTIIFSKIFKEKTGVSFNEYVISLKIGKAKDLLINTNMRISDIATQLQYNNSQNFIRVFKQITDLTPGEYRGKNQKL